MVRRRTQRGRRSTVVGAAVAILATTAGTATAGLPSGLTDVPVTAGNATPGIGGELQSAGAITGTVTAAEGGAPVSAYLTVFKNGVQAASTSASGSGNYRATSLRAGDYVVCATTFGATTGPGYLPRCYQNAPWTNYSPPGSATPVSVSLGQTTDSVNLALPTSAAITGVIRTSTGDPISNLTVIAYNRETQQTLNTYTSDTGTYTFQNLRAPAKGYVICAQPGQSEAAVGTGLLPRCYQHSTWNGDAITGSSGDAVHVALGTTTQHINIKLEPAAAVAGNITAAATGNPIKYAGVTVYNAKGRQLASGQTDTNGHYRVGNLPTATADQVCVNKTTITATSFYGGECWKNVAWNGQRLPAGTTGVSVNVGHVHGGIDFALDKTTRHLSSIAGVITEAAQGAPLSNAYVTAFKADGSSAGYGVTDSDGNYIVPNLHGSATGYFLCVNPFPATSTTATPATGWAGRCYDDVPWNGATIPKQAKLVPLGDRQQKTGIDIAVQLGGAITGTVTGPGGSATNGVNVRVFNLSGRQIAAGSTLSNNTYTVNGLLPGTYHVCFLPSPYDATGTGWLPQCYDQVAWNGQT